MEPDVNEAIVLNHVIYAMGAALVPIPLADLAAVTLIQYDMVERLADEYGVETDRPRLKAAVLAVAGATVARLGASLVKAVPGGGWLLGGATHLVLAGATTYALGEAYRQHFASDGTLDEVDFDVLRARYSEYVARGKEIARSLRDQVGFDATQEEEVAETLERLTRLRRAGVITQDEFRRLKEPLLRRG